MGGRLGLCRVSAASERQQQSLMLGTFGLGAGAGAIERDRFRQADVHVESGSDEEIALIKSAPYSSKGAERRQKTNPRN